MTKRNVKNNVFPLLINGDVWKIGFYTSKAFDKKHADATDALGIMDDEKMLVDFKIEHFKRHIALHEITHAYESYLCLGDVDNVTPDQLSELMAKFFEKNFEKLRRTVNQIMRLYRSVNGKL